MQQVESRKPREVAVKTHEPEIPGDGERSEIRVGPVLWAHNPLLDQAVQLTKRALGLACEAHVWVRELPDDMIVCVRWAPKQAHWGVGVVKGGAKGPSHHEYTHIYAKLSINPYSIASSGSLHCRSPMSFAPSDR